MRKKTPKANIPEDFPEIINHLLKHMDERFDQADERFTKIDGKFDDVFNQLDQIRFLVSGQERRISILEDRMRMVATKVGLEFRPQA
jgi:hypothetical protein